MSADEDALNQQPPVKRTFDVLMAVYGADDPKLFREAIDSVLNNSCQPSQFILVVDGPVGQGLESCIASLERISTSKIVRLGSNVGLARALNEGLVHVESEYFVRADADDINTIDRFAVLLDAVSSEDVLGSHVIEVDPASGVTKNKVVPLDHESICNALPSRNPFHHASVMVKTATALGAGGYPELMYREDYGMWVKICALGGRFGNLDKFLVRVTAGEDMVRRRGGLRYAFGEGRLQLFMMSYKVKGPIRALWDGGRRMLAFSLPFFIRKAIYAYLRG